MPAHAGLNIIHGKITVVKDFFGKSIKFGAPIGAPVCVLAAAAVVVAATVVIAAAVVHRAVVAAAAEQDQQDDDPPDITAAERIVAHKITSEIWI